MRLISNPSSEEQNILSYLYENTSQFKFLFKALTSHFLKPLKFQKYIQLFFYISKETRHRKDHNRDNDPLHKEYFKIND